MTSSLSHTAKTSSCPRDGFGFCLVAQLGHRLCPLASGECKVTDPEAAYAQAYDAAITRIFCSWRERMAARGAC